MTTKKYRTTRQGVKGILEQTITKGPRPIDRIGWDIYECKDRTWEQERFTPTREEID